MSSSLLNEVYLSLMGLTVFRNVRKDAVLNALTDLAACCEEALPMQLNAYTKFASLLWQAGGNWSDYLLELVISDENPYSAALARGEQANPLLKQAAEIELKTLQRLSSISAERVAAEIDCQLPLAAWQTSEYDFVQQFYQRMENIHRRGFGLFASYHMFRLAGEQIVPVQNADSVQLEQLSGYTEERKQVLENTQALLNGLPAANVLLYGDAGTGKSTTVKAVVNQLHEQGLRLIELRRDQLQQIPALVERLTNQPLKFIIFIDDLSFAESGEGFTALKAILEGSVVAKSSNIAIYATSNRRHLVREQFKNRQGDDVHLRDTLEEVSSLAERFGLLVTFIRPNKELYLQIVSHYCRMLGCEFSDETAKAAEKFALLRGGRSARAARQFAEQLVSGNGEI